jgi:hypothetical protein
MRGGLTEKIKTVIKASSKRSSYTGNASVKKQKNRLPHHASPQHPADPGRAFWINQRAVAIAAGFGCRIA